MNNWLHIVGMSEMNKELITVQTSADIDLDF